MPLTLMLLESWWVAPAFLLGAVGSSYWTAREISDALNS